MITSLVTNFGDIDALEKFPLPSEKIALLPQYLKDKAIERLPLDVINKAILQKRAFETEGEGCTVGTIKQCFQFTFINALNTLGNTAFSFFTLGLIRKIFRKKVVVYEDNVFEAIINGKYSKEDQQVEDDLFREDFLMVEEPNPKTDEDLLQ